MKKAIGNIFYVYFHYRKDDGKLFYIGKGNGNRAYNTTRRNIYWKRVVEKHGHIVKIVQDNLSESDAYELEEFCIIEYGLNKLTNMNYGGKGGNFGYEHTPETLLKLKNRSKRIGYNHSDETREKLRKANIGKTASDETKEKLSKNNAKNNLGKHLSEETKLKISIKNKGNAAWNKGIQCSEGTKKKISNATKGKTLSQESKANIGKGHIGLIAADETKKKMSEIRKEYHSNLTEEQKKIRNDRLKKLNENKIVSLNTKVKLSENAKNRIWINNGIISKFIKKDELENYLSNNYIIGRIKK